MENDLSILFEPIELSETMKLEIEPLAPLSMVNSMPGSYYRSLESPTKFMLCGMLENLLGWHFSEKHRKKIKRNLNAHFEDDEKYKDGEAESGYKPLINHLFEIETEYVPDIMHYDDIWVQHLKDRDERHLRGSRNYDWQLEKDINQLEDTRKARTDYFKKYKAKFPNYYASPKPREFVIAKSSYIYRLNTNKKFASLLFDFIHKNCSSAYLGTSEGWVEVNIEELS